MAMDDDQRELVRRLFAAATALIEDAHKAAAMGQSGVISRDESSETARRIEATARDAATFAKAAGIIAQSSAEQD